MEGALASEACGGYELRLEASEVLLFPQAPFALPAGDDHAFLLGQQVSRPARKNISYNPQTGEVRGAWRQPADQVHRLQGLLQQFAQAVQSWVAEALPRYRGGWVPDRVTYRPEEEAIRRLRHNARNDLLHIDAFPGRPARGRRILRVFANIHPTEPRVWATSDPLPALLERYRQAANRPRGLRDLAERVAEWFRRPERRRAPSDWSLLRLHDALKRNHRFQSRGPRRLWYFQPGAVWAVMTDTCSHGELRGRYALEHSLFISPEVLVRPELAPEALLARRAA